MRFSMPRGGVPGLTGTTWVRAEGPELPFPVYVRLGRDDEGRLVTTALLVGGDRVLTARELREVRLADIANRFAAEVSKPATYSRLVSEYFGGVTHRWAGKPPARVPRALQQLLPELEDKRPVARVRPGRRGHPPAHYREVAKAYRRAKREHPQAPIRALIRELHASEPTVHRWLNRAVKDGYLKESER
jgi:hypothetical protein